MLLGLLADHGAEVDCQKKTARLHESLIDRALATISSSFKLFDVLGDETHEFAGDNLYLTSNSARPIFSTVRRARCAGRLEDVSKFPELVRGLIGLGYTDEDICRIMGGNLLRIMRTNEAIANK